MEKRDAYLGIDTGSVTNKFAVLDGAGRLITSLYTRTLGRPIEVTQEGIRQIGRELDETWQIRGVATTGSARKLIGVIVGADMVKNEITAHAVGALHHVPEVCTVLEIGGQDSKVIMLRDGIVVDFSMNSVCAAGTGSFLDQQAYRLGIPIEEFGPLAMRSETPVRIAGRCTVFAESDMIHKQQMGHRIEDILYGLCQALARNYLNNLCLGKKVSGPVVFQGGVAANVGMRRAFQESLGMPVTVPTHYEVMGAIGAALLAQEYVADGGQPAAGGQRLTRFRGWEVSEVEYETSSFECQGCPNMCEVVQIRVAGEVLARWGGRCGKWEVL
jgi:predicted CoA-substrate-specific enzyme activase